MKKVISIFLLLLMLVIGGAHPVLAMHFCAGELYSFGVLNNEIEESCCEDMEMPQQGNDPAILTKMHRNIIYYHLMRTAVTSKKLNFPRMTISIRLNNLT